VAATGVEGAPKPVVTGDRTIALTGQHTMVVRPTTPDDVDGLTRLYAGLSADDLHLRFFAVYHPPTTFFERLARVAVDGHGYGLVAVTDDPDGPIVGEATYFLLDNGNGELAVTVARRWRGWLGPYLLDALITSAAARGVPNLEAEILVENRRMLAIMRRHGYALVNGADVSTVRLVVGTSTPTPTWPEPHDHARVLVEAPGGRWRNEQAARAAGLQVMVCPGPRPGRSPHCPALEGAPCPLVSGADVVFCELARDRVGTEDLRRAHASVHPTTPVLVRGDVLTPQETAIDPRAGDDVLITLLRGIVAGPTDASTAPEPATGRHG